MKHAEPIDTSAIVRTPTGESRLVARPRPILSKPSALPDAAATTKRQHIWSCASVETVGSARRVVCLRRRGGARRGGARAAAVVATSAAVILVGRRMLLLKLPVLSLRFELSDEHQLVTCNPQRGDGRSR